MLLIDGNPLLWRAAHSSPIEGIAQKVITYFFEVMSKFTPQDVVVCWDRGKSRWRTELYSEYKAHRAQKKRDSAIDLEALDEQLMLARRYLDAYGVRQVVVHGVEADDVLAWLAEYFAYVLGGWEVILATGDRDLWQLVSDRVHVYDHQKELFVDQTSAQAHFEVDCAQIPDLKALVGDASDNLPGVKGVGPKTGSALLRRFGSLGELLNPEHAKELDEKKSTSKILPEGDFLAEMYRLVKIPSLREAIHCLSEKERQVLLEQVSKPLYRDPMRVQILSEHIGRRYPVPSGLLPDRVTDLTGMVDYMEAYGAQNPSWGSLREVDWAISECNRCELRSHCGDKGPTYASGAEDREILLLGRNPGAQELENGVPFFPEAPAGSRLDRFLEQIGVSRSECWITNTCKCYSENNRPPTYPEVMACLPYLRAELDLLKPKFIICFGNEAMSAVTPYRSRVSKHCGEILENPTGLVGDVDAKVAICVHPSGALRSVKTSRDMDYAATTIRTFLDKVTR